jgi:hypothetical protein
MEADELQVDQHDQLVQEENSGLTISISSSEGASLANSATFQIATAGGEAQWPLEQDLNVVQ